ncbi:lipopolysaccharide biosynthesis protein [uncultured Amnibacterium sp.]|uniref:lipopolysaccharide biosynthesis protein n=1 Tax=uncultured Amnibacterium sp. TaxID=1631851 RepID=UPI0035C98464
MRPTDRALALARRAGGFGGSVLLMGVVSIAVVPVVIAIAGPTLWSGIAVAQAIGSFVGVVVAFGWGVTGPAEVGRSRAADRGAYFRGSIASRSWLAMPALPVMGVLVVLTAPGDKAADVLASIAMVMPALGASWFFVGERSPKRLFLLETVPRAIGTIAGAGLLFAHAPLFGFAACQVLGGLTAVVLSARSVIRRYAGTAALGPAAAVARLAGQTAGVLTGVTAALYVNLPVVLAGVFLPGQVAVYAVADKLQKLVLTGVTPVFQVAQGAVAHPDPEVVRSRAARSGRLAVGFGAFTALAFSLLGGALVRLLSGGRIEVPFPVLAALGVALGAICTSAIIGLACLTALHAVRQVAASTVLGAVAGIPLLVAGAVLFGLTGLAWAAAASEVLVAAYQIVHLRRLVRTQSSGGGPPIAVDTESTAIPNPLPGGSPIG